VNRRVATAAKDRPVIIASDCHDAERLAYLIAAGADVNRRVSSSRNEVLLGVAAMRGNVDACKILLEAGADPNLGALPNLSPLCLLIEARWLADMRLDQKMAAETAVAVLQLLVAHGCDPNGRGEPGKQQSSQLPLYVAANYGDHELVKELVRLGADPDRAVGHLSVDGSYRRVEKCGSTLMLLNGRVTSTPSLGAMMVTLLRLGADDACIADPGSGKTAFQVAVMVGHDELVEYYARERGENLKQRVNGRTLEASAWKDGTKALIRSLKAELAIDGAVAVHAASETMRDAFEKNRGGPVL
jgi:ankyrin repeat protein